MMVWMVWGAVIVIVGLQAVFWWRKRQANKVAEAGRIDLSNTITKVLPEWQVGLGLVDGQTFTLEQMPDIWHNVHIFEVILPVKYTGSIRLGKETVQKSLNQMVSVAQPTSNRFVLTDFWYDKADPDAFQLHLDFADMATTGTANYLADLIKLGELDPLPVTRQEILDSMDEETPASS